MESVPTTTISERCKHSVVSFPLSDRSDRTRSLVCAPDHDVIIQSSDDVLFKLHRKNLEVHSLVFSDAAAVTGSVIENKDEIVELSEDSATLDVLFRYMYNQPQPDLSAVDFLVVTRLAVAAEKYTVNAAIPAILIHMARSLEDHPLHVLDYAFRNDNAKLANAAAELTVGLSVCDAHSLLSQDAFAAWILYYDRWSKGVRALLSALIDKNVAQPIYSRTGGVSYPVSQSTLATVARWKFAEVRSQRSLYNIVDLSDDFLDHTFM
ncbi:unnamed protein product [Mycena citricolor]|uniref:BTB domain-containing protein n=1 Tax=Mycena citricolor TaxID=2018698 RepID=A0AAD2HTA1_9AGAR|nr:unnamed protein product [Mycena citricolor]